MAVSQDATGVLVFIEPKSNELSEYYNQKTNEITYVDMMIIIDKKPLVNYFQKMNTTTKCVCAFKKQQMASKLKNIIQDYIHNYSRKE